MESLGTLQLPPVVVELLRLCVWLVLLLVIFIPLERLASLHPQPVFRKGFFTDLAYYFLSSLSPKFLLLPATAVLALVLRHLVPHGLHERAAALPLAARFAAAMIVGEFGSYWGHRWSHEFPLLWRFHAVHHSAQQMDWLVNTKAHPVDLVFTRLCGFVPLYILGLALPAANTMDVVPLLVILTGTVWGFFIHANLRWRCEALGWVLSTPAFHHWHHTLEAPLNRNYASMLPWLDRIFGTYHLPSAEWPAHYGTDAAVASTLAEQLLDPMLPGYRAAVPVEPGKDPV